MARLDETGNRIGGRLGFGGTQRWVAIAAIVVVLFLGIGVWWGTTSTGVELERSEDGETTEPVDPGDGDGGDATEEARENATADGDGESDAVPAVTKVHVDGAVAVPGVYEIVGADPRVADAVAAAGGLTDDADTSAVNLAAQLHDADKVHVPRIEESAPAVQGVGEVPAGSSTTAAESASAGTVSSGAGNPSGPINVNTATAEELTALPGIGEKTAEKIVADREAQGPFASPEDLMRVSGIGEKKFAQVKDLICV